MPENDIFARANEIKPPPGEIMSATEERIYAWGQLSGQELSAIDRAVVEQQLAALRRQLIEVSD